MTPPPLNSNPGLCGQETAQRSQRRPTVIMLVSDQVDPDLSVLVRAVTASCYGCGR